MSARASNARAALLAALLTATAAGHIGSPDVYVRVRAGGYGLLVAVHPPAAAPGAAEVDVRAESGAITAISATGGGAAAPLRRFAAEQAFTGSAWVKTAAPWTLRLEVQGDHGAAVATVPVPALPASAGAAPGLTVEPAAGGGLRLTLAARGRGFDDLALDHGYPMHLFAVRQPGLDVVLHLHPARTGANRFEVALPSMAPGAYTLYADVVHRDGAEETASATVGLPMQTGHVLAGDDSMGIAPSLARGMLPNAAALPDGYRMTLAVEGALRARSTLLLRATLQDRAGRPPADMTPYLGMAAHAAVVKSDGAVFAHIHPGGTLPMAALMPAMSGATAAEPAASTASFPYGFPTPGLYRVFVQMKHGRVVETGAFDLRVN